MKLILGFLLGAALSCVIQAVGWDVVTPLDEYVFSDDGAYSYEEITSYDYDGVTVYIYNMTSQVWFDENWVDRPVWYHYLHIAIPDVIQDSSWGFLVVEGGSNNPDEIPERFDHENVLSSLFAQDVGVIVGYLQHVPNQPLVFPEDPTIENRSEDEIIAWTWYKFIETYQNNVTDPNYLALFPMVKSAKRALDTIQTVAAEKVGFTNITNFAVGGASKRGWTTWLLSAVDQRVKISVPIVFSILNMPANLMHHYQSLGGWTFAFEDYWVLNLTQYVNDPVFAAMAEHIDPFSYRERLTMPKLLTSGTNDEFFLPDETPFWWNEMPGPMYLQMVNNGNHALIPRILYGYEHISTFITANIQGIELPTLDWTFGSDGTVGWINMTTSPVPNRVRAFVADTLETNNRRDYRRQAGYPDETFQPVIWLQTDVIDNGGGNYAVVVEYPAEGEYRAFFLEARWPGVNDRNIVFTTEVNIIPEELPFPPCDRLECISTCL